MNDMASRVAALSPEKRELMMRRLREQQQVVVQPEPLPQIVPDPARRFEPFPLTDVQQAYYAGRTELFELGGYANVFLEYAISYRLPPQRPALNRQALVGWLAQTFRPELIDRRVMDVFLARLNAALGRLIDRHDMLRAVVLPDGTQQVLAEVPDYRITVLDLRGRPDAEAELERQRERLRYTQAPIDRWPLFEFVACPLDGQRLRLMVRVDPLIIDGESRGVLIAELNQLLLNPGQPLPPLACSYRDFAVTWAAGREHPLVQRARDYWFKQIATMPPAPELPLARPPGPQVPARFQTHAVELLDPATWEQLRRRAALAGLTPSGVAMAAFVELLGAWSRRREFTLGLIGTYHPPIHPRIQDVFGNFNTIGLLVADPLPGPFAERAVWLQKRLLADLDQPYVSGHAVLRELARRDGGSSAALIPIFFNSVIDNSRDSHPFNRYMDGRDAAPRGPSLFQMSEVEVGPYIPQLQLMLIVRENEAGALLAKWQLVEGLLPQGLPEEMQDAYGRLLRRLADDDEAWQERSLALVATEQAALRARPALPAPAAVELLPRQIAGVAARSPQAPAVLCGEQRLSYGELLASAELLAQRLRADSCGPGTLVALVFAPGVEQVVTALGVALAGASALPLSPELPAEQLHAALEQSGAALALRPREAGPAWPARIARRRLDDTLTPGEPNTDDALYAGVNFGPDGQAGGMMISHAVAAQTIQSLNQRAGIRADDRALLVAPLGAGQQLGLILATLASGGALVIPDGEAGDPAAWARLIAQERITVWLGTPALLDLLLAHEEQAPAPSLGTLRAVLVSHDRIPPRLAARLRERVPAARLFALGCLPGVALWVTLAEIKHADFELPRVPYGHPLAEQRVEVLDEQQTPRPAWAPGSVVLAGSDAARSWGDPQAVGGMQGRFLPDGALDLIGPDDQASCYRHGYRIELHQVEAALEQNPALRAACVVAVPEDQPRRGSRLIAYVVPAQLPGPSEQQILDTLAERLPAAAQPDAVVARSSLPLDYAGRVDRAALRAAAPAPDEPACVCDAVEQTIVQIWQEVLNVPSVAARDNFFDQGGSSFGAVQLLTRIQAAYQVQVATSFFADPTLANLVEAVRRAAPNAIQRSSIPMAQQTATRPIVQPGNPPKLINFILIWIGQVVSIFGSGLGSFALGVWVFQQTGSVTMFALISVSGVLPGIVISPFAGALVDRWSRRTVMLLSNLGSSLVALAVTGLLYGGMLATWQIYIATALLSVFGAFLQPAFAAATTLLVPKQFFGRASGMVQTGGAIARVIAPVLAGVLVVSLDIWGVILIDFGTFMFALLTLLLARVPSPQAAQAAARPAAAPAGAPPAGRRSLFQEAGDGWRYIAARPGMLLLLLFFAVTNFTLGCVQVLVPPLTLSFADPTVLGGVLGVAGLGLLGGGIVMSIWAGPQRRLPIIMGATLIQGLILFLGGLQPSAPLIAAAAFVFLFASPVITSASQAIWQSKVPAEIQGRVFAIRTMIAWSSLPLAYLLAGPLSDYVFAPLMAADGPLAGSVGRLIGVGPGRGIGLLFILLGAVVVLAVLAGYSYPRLRRLEQEIPDAIGAEPARSSSATPVPHQHQERASMNTSPPTARAGTGQSSGQVVTLALDLNTMLSLLSVLLIGLLIFGGLSRLAPPAPLPETAPAGEFSAYRALRHVQTFAQVPHPVGSPERAAAAQYLQGELTKLGLIIQTEPTEPGHFDIVGREIVALLTGDLRNIVARLPGSTPGGKAILLFAHYDSIPSGPGASDGGAAVATILETLRAVRSSGQPLKNDIIVLFTDGEEYDLMGVRGFIKNPWFKDVGIGLHFVARGTAGPSIMFETSPENGWMIEQLAAVAPHPVANSLAYEIYRYLPNGTDFTVVRSNGVPGMNFAYIDEHVNYHTVRDSVENLNMGSLQHHGSYALALTRHLGNLDLSDIKRDNAIYFDIWSLTLIHYPERWALPITVLVGLVFLAVLVAGLRRRKLSWGGLGAGTLALPLAAGLSYGSTTLIWQIVLALHDEYRFLPHGEVYHPYLYLGAFMALTVAITATTYVLLARRFSALDLSFGALVVWMAGLVATTVALPGATYLFAWPLLASLLGVAYLLSNHAVERPGRRFVALSLGALPGLILLPPTIYLIYMALTVVAGNVVMLAVTLLLGLLVGHLLLISRPRPWWLPIGAALASLALLVAGSFSAGFDAQHPKPNSIAYIKNGDTGQAFWVSQDPKIDEWTGQFIPRDAKRGRLDDVFPLWPASLFPNVRVFRSEAPSIDIAPPQIEVLSNTSSGDVRTLRVRVTSVRQGQSILLRLHSDISSIKELRAGFNGRLIDYTQRLGERKPSNDVGLAGSFVYYNPPPEGIEFEVEMTDQPLFFYVYDLTRGLPDLPSVQPRPASMMPSPSRVGDSGYDDDQQTCGYSGTNPMTVHNLVNLRLPAVESVVTDRATELPEHLIELPGGGWSLWRCVGLRGTGFPASAALALAAPQAAAAADALALAEQAAEAARAAAIAALEQAAAGPARDYAQRALGRLRKGQLPPAPPTGVEEPAELRALRADSAGLEQARAAFRQSFVDGVMQASQAIYEVVGSERFREAVTWQNRHALLTAVRPILRNPPGSAPRGSQRRQHEELVASYIQRYCLKNDTIGFFGPVGWACLESAGQPLTAQPGPRLLSKRSVYFEIWCIEKLAETLAKNKALRPWLAPRRMPFLHVEGMTLHLPGQPPARLSPAHAALLRACDGRRTARELAQRLVLAPELGLHSEQAVYQALEDLEARGLLVWALDIPYEGSPERRLREILERIEDERLRALNLRALSILDQARARVAQAAGSAEQLEQALGSLENLFTRMTSSAATRAAGKTYAGRTLVYEDCQRDIDVAIGPQILTELGPPLGLLLTSARWFTHEAASVYRKLLRATYEELARTLGTASVPLSLFMRQAEPRMFDQQNDPLMPVERRFQERWARLLDLPPGRRQAHYRSRDLRPHVEELFAAPRPGWHMARYHSPDIMIDAPDVDAVNRGDYQLIMGELHIGTPTLRAGFFLDEHPNAQEIEAARALDVPEPRLVPIAPRTWPGLTTRTRPGLILPHDFRLAFSYDACWPTTGRRIESGALLVELRGDDLVVRSRDGRLCFDAIEFFAEVTADLVISRFNLIAPVAHAPRITIDRLVVSREMWRVAAGSIPFAHARDEAERFSGARRWKQTLGLPRFVFIKTPVEKKPMFVDFDSPIFVNIFAKTIRRTVEQGAETAIVLREMLPTPDQLWLADAEGQRYTSELRITAVDTATDA